MVASAAATPAPHGGSHLRGILDLGIEADKAGKQQKRRDAVQYD
jgi:hypothetical protein